MAGNVGCESKKATMPATLVTPDTNAVDDASNKFSFRVRASFDCLSIKYPCLFAAG